MKRIMPFIFTLVSIILFSIFTSCVEPTTCIVTFNAKGGEFDDTNEKTKIIPVPYGKKIKPPIPKQNSLFGNIRFVGWYTDDIYFTKPFDFDTPITEDMTMYAAYGDYHKIIIDNTKNGTIETSGDGYYCVGDLVTLIITPAENCELDTLEIKQKNFSTEDLLDVKFIAENEYTKTFLMPGVDIKIIATFKGTTVPPIPQNVKVIKYTVSRRIDVKWDTVAGADSYVVYYRSKNSELNSIETENTYITLKELQLDTEYEFWVIAKNSIGNSDNSNVVSAIIKGLPAPTNLEAYYISWSNYFQLSWKPVAGATGYKIYYSRYKDEEAPIRYLDYVTPDFELNRVYKSIDAEKIGSKTTYNFYVQAVNNTTESDLSEPCKSIYKSVY